MVDGRVRLWVRRAYGDGPEALLLRLPLVLPVAWLLLPAPPLLMMA